MDESSFTVSQDKSSLFLKCSSQALVTVMTSKVNANSILSHKPSFSATCPRENHCHILGAQCVFTVSVIVRWLLFGIPEPAFLLLYIYFQKALSYFPFPRLLSYF